MGILIPGKRLKAALTFCVAFILLFSGPSKAAIELYEQKIKAGLVYNFLKYTTWPALSGKQIRVCLFGADSFDGYLAPLEGRTAQQFTISISNIEDVEDAAGCNLVFIHSSEDDSVPDLLDALKDKSVLTVSDIRHFARDGGMVEMSTEDEQVTLYVNPQAVSRAGLHIQDRMMKLAKKVPE